MRGFIRHPSDIPIEYQRDEDAGYEQERVNNICEGGLSFNARDSLEKDAVIRLRIPLVRPVFEAWGKVMWCRHEDSHYEVGIRFLDVRDAFRVRMVEQVCHIEHYKREVQATEGRTISSQQAALEWISKYASDFPSPGDDTTH